MELERIARAWLAEDPDPNTRAQIEAMLDAGDQEALQACFGGRLQFGTAGIRGVLGPGPGRMNRALARRVSAGFAVYLLETAADTRQRGVVIGRDGRHLSEEIARDAAEVFAAHGIPVWIHEETAATPQLAHAVVALGAAGGVMVTASHNPPEYNGYKAYWSNGAQIVPPHDAGISAAIDAVTCVLPEGTPAPTQWVPEEVVDAYLDEVEALRVRPCEGIRVAYTALHGIGSPLMRRVMADAGHTLHEVAEQAEPDGDFPTVRFPNPEEPGAMDLVLALAQEVGADLVLANDPDADRLAVAVPDGESYRQLTGNEVGCLLADYLLRHGTGSQRLVATTVVSSQLLSRLADEFGVDYAETLTGFKWIANAALAYEAGGGSFVVGYEEALGYSVGPVVRDKDGISAAMLMADLAAWCRAENSSVLAYLEAIYRRHGVFASAQHSLVLPGAEGAARIATLMDEVRSSPPWTVAGIPVRRVRDLASGTARLPDGSEEPLTSQRGNVMALDLADGSRVLVRPSGTEPKIKFYVEVRIEVAADEPIEAASSRAGALIERILADIVPA